jgi:uncharacterized protein YqeY|tara:strand:- start:245 stop:706 length:462 start_codon:yes stop_codon:yes gene_type:complete
MSIKEKINDEYKTALKSKDKNKISTYRLILSGIKDLDISNRSGPNKKETDDEDIKKLLKKMIKQRNESVEIYKKNKREDLLKIEQGEIDLLSTFLPKQLSEEETKKICSEIISKVGAQSIKDMGKIMGELKKNYSDSIDFSKAGSILKELLNK